MHSSMPVEQFERILDVMSQDEMSRLLVLLEQNLSEKKILNILVQEFDLESKGFNCHGFPFMVPLPVDWDWITPELKTPYDIYKHFPVITDRIQNMVNESYSIMWHNKKYETRFEETHELPEDFHEMMIDRLMTSLKASDAWIVKPARHAGEICYVVLGNEVSGEIIFETEGKEVSVCDTESLICKPTAMEMGLAALANLKTQIPLIYNQDKNCENTIIVDVYVRELLAKHANIDKVRFELETKLKAHSIWTLKSLGDRKGFVLTVKA